MLGRRQKPFTMQIAVESALAGGCRTKVFHQSRLEASVGISSYTHKNVAEPFCKAYCPDGFIAFASVTADHRTGYDTLVDF